jgi:hypothetical protein
MPTLLIDGIVSPILSLKAIQPSMTEMSSLRHSSTVFPDAQTPSSSGTSPNMGSGSSMTLYSALSRAAMIYSANIIKANLEILGEISCAVRTVLHPPPGPTCHSRMWLAVTTAPKPRIDRPDRAAAGGRACAGRRRALPGPGRARMRARASHGDIGQRALAGGMRA